MCEYARLCVLRLISSLSPTFFAAYLGRLGTKQKMASAASSLLILLVPACEEGYSKYEY